MRRYLGAAILALALAEPAAAADWFTETKDDLFSGKKTATMIGGTQEVLSLYATCEGERQFVVSLIFKMDKPADIAELDGTMAIKVDDLSIHKVAVSSYAHNGEFAGFRSAPADVEAIAAIREIGQARHKIVIALDVPAVNNRMTSQIRSSGSTRAVSDLLSACEL